jgi:ribosomal-protein-alanine N-acetyltransferase
MTLAFPPCMETDVIRLRPPSAADAVAVFEAIASDERTTRYLAWARHRELAETVAFLEKMRRSVDAGERHCYLVEDKTSGAALGFIDLALRLPFVEIGVVTTHRHGLMRRAATLHALRRLIEWTLAQPVVSHVFAGTATNNLAHRVLERLGFVRKAVVPHYAPQPNLGDKAVDYVLYVRANPDWRGPGGAATVCAPCAE